MNPKKVKDLIAKQAEKENIPAEDLWDIVNFYYHQQAIAASKLLHPRLSIIGLGTLSFKHWKVDEVGYMTERFMKMAAALEKDKQHKAKGKERKEKREYNSKTFAMRERRAKLKEQQNQKLNDTKGETTEGMGEQGSDS